MKSSSSSSCFGTLFWIVLTLVVIRFAMPSLWKIIASLFAGTFYFGVTLFVVALVVLGFFTYKNLKGNRQRQEEKKFERVHRAEELYHSVVHRLQGDLVLNQVSAEEFLQSEIVVTEVLPEYKKDLIRLKDFVSPKNQRIIRDQIRDYEKQLRQSSDAAVQDVIQENLKMLTAKQLRIADAGEEIREKEASLDLISNSLLKVEEDLRFGRPVTRLFPVDVYRRFGVTAPSDQERLPPLQQRSSIEE